MIFTEQIFPKYFILYESILWSLNSVFNTNVHSVRPVSSDMLYNLERFKKLNTDV